MKTQWLIAAAMAVGLFAAPPAAAQRGVGESGGLARQGVDIPMVQVYGSIVEVKIEPCEMTTGHSIIGAHLILRDEDERLLNLHLGPADELADLIAVLEEGQEVRAEVFRTENLPEDAYVVRALTVGGETHTLRDATLRPIWAGTARPRNGQGAGPRGGGRGPRF